MLGVSRQSINKLIKQLEAEQLIQMHYGRVIVRDLHALRAIAHAEGTGAIVD
jgi:DNA-binding GntR family transcriptional regulator